jgi:hypothetical protein
LWCLVLTDGHADFQGRFGMSATPKRRTEKPAPDARCDGSRAEKEPRPQPPDVDPQEMKNQRRKGGRRLPPRGIPDGRKPNKGGRAAAR